MKYESAEEASRRKTSVRLISRRARDNGELSSAFANAFGDSFFDASSFSLASFFMGAEGVEAPARCRTSDMMKEVIFEERMESRERKKRGVRSIADGEKAV